MHGSAPRAQRNHCSDRGQEGDKVQVWAQTLVAKHWHIVAAVAAEERDLQAGPTMDAHLKT